MSDASTVNPDRHEGAAMSTLELRDLHKVYPNGFHAVRGVTASIADGEFVAIVGPSGCGKTSVLRMIAGLETVTSGEIAIDGQLVNDDTPQQRDIAMAFQQHALYPHLSVEQNIGFALKVAGIHRREIRRRVVPLAEQLGLGDVLGRRPSQLSGGQQQRVAMARAIIRDPRLFLMDEPLSNLDAKLRTEARSMILSLQREMRATTVYVTHDQLEAMSMAHRVFVMRDGEIVQRGVPIEVYQHPNDLFVASFLGSPSMNVFRGRFESTIAGGVVLRFGAHTVPLHPSFLDVRPEIRDRLGQEVAVGIRPEALHLDPHGELELSVHSAESHGHEWLVRLVVEAQDVSSPAAAGAAGGPTTATGEGPYSTLSFVAALDHRPSLWAPIRLRLDPTELHVFDLATGTSVGTPIAA